MVLIGPAFLYWALFQQLVLGVPFGDKPVDNYVLILAVFLFGVGLPVFMYITGLDTEVGEYGIRIRFRPFHRSWVEFRFDSIKKAESVKYSPLKDYGGWGIRYGGNGKAYSVSGNKGIMLSLNDGKSVLIGSKNQEVFWAAINERLS